MVLPGGEKAVALPKHTFKIKIILLNLAKANRDRRTENYGEGTRIEKNNFTDNLALEDGGNRIRRKSEITEHQKNHEVKLSQYLSQFSYLFLSSISYYFMMVCKVVESFNLSLECFLFLLLCWVGEHCSIYNTSNIS
jgi:hypothetical protein